MWLATQPLNKGHRFVVLLPSVKPVVWSFIWVSANVSLQKRSGSWSRNEWHWLERWFFNSKSIQHRFPWRINRWIVWRWNDSKHCFLSRKHEKHEMARKRRDEKGTRWKRLETGLEFGYSAGTERPNGTTKSPFRPRLHTRKTRRMGSSFLLAVVERDFKTDVLEQKRWPGRPGRSGGLVERPGSPIWSRTGAPSDLTEPTKNSLKNSSSFVQGIEFRL